MSASVTVTKLSWRGETVYSWGGEAVARGPGYVTLRAVWKGPGTVRVAEDVVFERGDIFYEHYYDGKPYGLWQVLTPDERTLKCWYCNISTPAHVNDDTITFRDLLLDVLLLPDGTCRVLDCDELARARAEGLDPALAALAEEGAREVLDLIATGRPPFGGESVQSGKRPTPG
jgi:predicted RNA-binding protein associated with RNAse of E/G family